MRPKSTKKLISLQNFDVLDLWIKDVSNAESRSESTVAEEVLLGMRAGMLPKSPAARDIILNCYDDGDAVSRLYCAAFLYCESRVNTPDYDPQFAMALVRSLIWQLYQMDDRIQACAITKMPYYKSAFGEIIDLLHLERTKLRGDASTLIYHTYQTAGAMMQQLHNAPHLVQCHHLMAVIQSAWEYLAQYPATFRFLRTQVDLLSIPNNSTTRLAVIKALHEASAHWPD